jgi:hypothetical protein
MLNRGNGTGPHLNGEGKERLPTSASFYHSLSFFRFDFPHIESIQLGNRIPPLLQSLPHWHPEMGGVRGSGIQVGGDGGRRGLECVARRNCNSAVIEWGHCNRPPPTLDARLHSISGTKPWLPGCIRVILLQHKDRWYSFRMQAQLQGNAWAFRSAHSWCCP